MTAITWTLALANGGPVDWTRATGLGDLEPVDQTVVALSGEDLKIALDEDGQHFQVAAHYVLSNPGAPVTVKYGVPVFWYAADIGDFDVTPETEQKGDTPKERAYAATVQISLNDQSFPCHLEAIRRAKGQNYEGEFSGWCVTDISIPSGDSIPLTLSYQGSLRFVDSMFSKSPFTKYGIRTFQYDLSPAGHWAGPVQDLSVEIDTGIWSDFFELAPSPAFLTDGSRRTLRRTNVDLKTVGSIRANLIATPVLESRERTAYKSNVELDATASSELPNIGADHYSAANLLDGKASTAWCSARGRLQELPWIEIRPKRQASIACPMQSYVIVPGYSKSQSTWIENNRIRRIRLGPCGSNREGTRIQLTPSSRADSAAVEIVPSDKAAGINQDTSCVRLTIEGVDEGPTRDTCISEFKPVFNCG